MTRIHSRLAAAILLSLAVGCSDDDETPSDGLIDAGLGDATVSPDSAAPDAGTSAALYTMNNEVYAGESSTTYINVFKSLEIAQLDTSRALEQTGGRSTIGVNDGKLFVTVPSKPVIQRYAVADDGSFKTDGEISFSNFGSTGVGLDEWSNLFLSPTKAYLSYEGALVVWNPSTLQIVKEIDVTTLPKKEGTQWSPGSSGMVKRGNRVYFTRHFTNWTTYEQSPENYLVAIDSDADTVLSVTQDDRCRAFGNRPDIDSKGNLYFSNWVWNIPGVFRNNSPKNCVLRLPAGADKFDDWKLTYADVTGGREGAMFALLNDTTAVISVFEIENGVNDPTKTPGEFATQRVWRLYKVDLTANTAAPIEGFPTSTGASSTFHIDGRNFVFSPTEMVANTLVNELVGTSTVTVTPRFTATGWSYQFYRLR